jgi:hypothetical protein
MSLGEPLPEKPKWMRWRTYRRWEAKAEEAEAQADAGRVTWLRRRGHRELALAWQG